MCIREMVISSVVVLILVSPIFITESDEIDLFNDQRLLVDNYNYDHEVFNKAEQLLLNAPRAFTANCGQMENDEVLFYDQGGSVWFTDNGVWFEVREEILIEGRDSRVRSRESDKWFNPMGKFEPMDPVNYKRVILKQEFVGANEVRPEGRERLSWKNNFFYGNDSSRWCTNVPNYAEIWFENIYDGIDLRYYKSENGLKYDFIVYPGADINQIRIRYDGAEKILIDESENLIIKTQIENIVDGGLYIYQDRIGQHHKVEGRFTKYDDLEYGFELQDNYNKFKNIVIDPFIYSTYVGGIFADASLGISIDPEGNAFVTGHTSSIDFPNTTGVFDQSFNGRVDVIVFKLNQDGSALHYSTFIGGTLDNLGYSIAIDSKGNAYISGVTKSSDFPTTTSAFDTSFNGGTNDIFVCKLNHNGSALNYSTYIGGTNFELYPYIEVDSAGRVFVKGTTNSSDFPTTTGAYNTTLNGLSDVYVLKLNWNGSKILYSTLIGGSNVDVGIDICIDNEGNAYVTGETNSTDFPTTSGANDSSFNGGFSDGFIFKINSNGSALIYSTYLGGDQTDSCWDTALDLNGCILVTGQTSSSNFPITSNAINTTYNGNIDCFVTRLNFNGSKLNYSTFLSGTDINQGLAIAVDLMGNVYVTGSTWSPNFFTTPGAFDSSYNGLSDCFVVKFHLPYYSAFVIQSVSLLLNSTPVDIAYSRYDTYTIRVKLVNTEDISDLVHVLLLLDPLGKNIELLFHPSPGLFSIVNDDDKYISLNSSSNFYYYNSQWIIDFNLSFNWNYPDEELNDIHTFVVSETLPSIRLNVSDLFRVENDLAFNGSLVVIGEDNSTIIENELVRGREKLNWTGLEVVYENTTNVYPPDNEYDVIIWHENVQLGSDSPLPGNNFSIQTNAPSNTNLQGYQHFINISRIPAYCDKTNETFTIKIDGDNVTFYEPIPNDTIWQNNSDVNLGITIKDIGGGIVNGSSIMHSISNDNGTTWSNWTRVPGLVSLPSINVIDIVQFEDGVQNLVRWRAKDSVDNGPAVSSPYRVLVDTKPVFFSDPIPLANQIFTHEEVKVGINISDITSGVNTSRITYSTSTDAGLTWSTWMTLIDVRNVTIISDTNGNNIKVLFNQTFLNGTDNRIRWRASDLAGNGPTESDIYIIKINTWMKNKTKFPKVRLWNPPDSANIETGFLNLSWLLVSNEQINVTYDLYLDNIDPPNKRIYENLTNKYLMLKNLENGQTYYWTVIPRLNNINGSCLSGIWSFTVDILLPKAILKTPANNSEITSTLPTLVWSLDYEGTDKVTYDIYFGTNKDPPLNHEKLSTTYFAIDTALQDNITYYWKIVPWAGKYEGFSSEIWSFTVKLKEEQIPEFDIKLDLNPNPLEIKPGEVKFVSAIVTNLGELTDNFTIIIGDINNSKLNAENYRQDTLGIEPGKNKEFLMMVSIKDGTEPGFENITIAAKSKLAEKYNLDVRDSHVLTIKILEKDDQEGKEQGQPISIFYFSILLLIIILIIISIIIVILIRKKSSKKDSEIEKTKDIQPEISPESFTTLEPEPVPLPQQDETMEE